MTWRVVVMAEDERIYTIVVHAVGLTDSEVVALFDRVADAAHDLNQSVTCAGGYDVEARIKAEGVREAAAEWSEWEVFTADDGHRAIRQHEMEPDEWLRAWADRKVSG